MHAPARLRSLGLVASVVLATIGAPAATGGAAACADEGSRAALVVDTGVRVISLCVELDAAEVSGLRLIELASAQHGLTYAFGLGGAAVCRLDGVGPAGGDCFAEYPEYWGYWHGDGRGGWTWASSGAGSYRVGDGDVEGWVWGAGDTGGTHAAPPPLALDDVCDPPAEPTVRPTRTPSPTARPEPDASATPEPPSRSTTPAPSTSGDAERTRTPRISATPSPATSTSDASVLAVGTPPADGGGPPAGLFVAVGLALLLSAGGWLRLRSRTRATA